MDIKYLKQPIHPSNESKNSYSLELENCNFVKTILMLLVILYHSCIFWKGDWFDGAIVATKSDVIRFFAEWLNSFLVYAFVLVSGYVFYYLKVLKKKYLQLGSFLIGKIKRLVIPYCFITILWVIPLTCLWVSYSWKDIFLKYFLAISPSQLWFLLMLFWCYCLAYFTTDIVSRNSIAIIITFLSFGIGIIGNHFIPNYFQIWSGFSFFPFFILGMKLSQGEWKLLRKIPLFIYFFIHSVLFVILMFFPSGKAVYSAFRIVIGFVLHYIGAITVFFVLQYIGGIFKWKSSHIFQSLYKHQMIVYLLHQQIVYISIIIFNGRVNPFIICIFNFTIAICASYLIGSLFLKWKITRFLIGEKQ